MALHGKMYVSGNSCVYMSYLMMQSINQTILVGLLGHNEFERMRKEAVED
jgi:hypothetical protein